MNEHGDGELDELRSNMVRLLAAYDREIAHPKIYEDLKDD